MPTFSKGNIKKCVNLGTLPPAPPPSTQCLLVLSRIPPVCRVNVYLESSIPGMTAWLDINIEIRATSQRLRALNPAEEEY